MNIHFICRGNVLRSLTAETYLKSLRLKNINVISSGTNVDWDNETEKEYFSNTLNLLDRNGIKSLAKDRPDQLTQSRIDGHDITVCMNQRVIDEARAIVDLPENIVDWNIIDIGEGHRIDKESRERYEDEIYDEIISKVDALVELHKLN